jgi:hypothetical protein
MSRESDSNRSWLGFGGSEIGTHFGAEKEGAPGSYADSTVLLGCDGGQRASATARRVDVGGEEASRR